MKTGFARVDITPFLGVGISGYFNYRFTSGVRDELYASAVAFGNENKKAVIMSLDIIGINIDILDGMIEKAAEACGIDKSDIIIACTHTHTGPSTSGGDADEQYNAFLARRIRDAAVMACNDMTESEIFVGKGNVYDISFIRRYRMKDGSVRTNPGLFNPDVAGPIGTPDTEEQTRYIKRNGKKDIMLVQFQVHPDVIGGTMISADFPGFVRSTVEKLRDVYCVYFNGCQGDTNHIDTAPKSGKAKGGYAHSRAMGELIASAALASLEQLVKCESDEIKTVRRMTDIKLKKPSPEEAKEAIELAENNEEGNFYSNSMETLGKFELGRLLILYKGLDSIKLPVCGIKVSDVCIVSMPGEPFTEIGRQIKASSKYKATFVCCCANGYEGYLPTNDAFEGGYEAISSIFAPGIAETLIEAGKEIVKD